MKRRLILLALGLAAIGFAWRETHPSANTARDLKLGPLVRPSPDSLSPLAKKLRSHVVILSGERCAPRRASLDKAMEYVEGRFREYGCAPQRQAYGSKGMGRLPNGTTFYNILAEAGGEGPLRVIGAHYDTACGTPGADDNASAVAVLLELGRLLRERPPKKRVLLAAFSTEEPPAYGTLNMGSRQHAKRLRAEGARVEGMISLEMLGYFDSRKGSQVKPPFIGLFSPDSGGFVALVSNRGSLGWMRAFRRRWRSELPLESFVLPEISLARLSDHANYWGEGFPALMLTDTAYLRNPHYHQAGDLPDTLDYEAMAEITRGLAEALSE